MIMGVALSCYGQFHTMQINPDEIDINNFDPMQKPEQESANFLTIAQDFYQNKEYERATKYYLAYLSQNQDDATNWYNLACCFALMNQPEQASKYLKISFKKGFTDLNHISKDTDFDSVRDEKEFTMALDSLQIWKANKASNLGKMEYFPAKNLIPYWIHLPKNYDKNKSYTLLIGLHGYGDKAYSYTNLWKYLEDSDVIFVVPQAPYAFTQGNNAGFSWGPFVPQGSKTYETAFNMLSTYLLDLQKHLKSQYKIDQVWLNGFSQGAFMGYMLTLKNPKYYDGLLACGGGLVTEAITEKDYKAGKKVKVIISHGKDDAIVKYEEGQKAYGILKAKGFDVTLLDFKGGHTVSQDAFKAFLKVVSPATKGNKY
jgi:phospholipase/carboxylesterase